MSAPTLVEIVTALAEVYDDRGAVIWLTAAQARWPVESRWTASDGHRKHSSALELIATGRSDEVMDRIDQLQSGAFA